MSTHQRKSRRRIPASNLTEADGCRHQDHSPLNVQQAERDSTEKDTRKLIVAVAERLFRQIGFQNTSVADMARELHMSPTNVYRFFAKKSEINEAVCIDLFGKIEAEARQIAAASDTASQRIRDLIGSLETTHHKQYMGDRELYELIKASITENPAIMRQHNERIAEVLEQIIASGMASGEFSAGDPAFTARLVNTACVRFCDPRLIMEYRMQPDPTLNQLIDFCIGALAKQPP